jgi:pimeloyl-ACP methyl ester carboxylesterase
MDLATSTSFAERLADITAPTLVVGGGNDPMFTRDVLEAVAAPLGARLEFLESGHEVPLEQPARLAAMIDTFVAELTAPGRQPVSSTSA